MDLNLFDNSISGYVYLIRFRDTGQYYYGSRYANIKLGIPPEQDLLKHYFTSSNVVRQLLESASAHNVEAHILLKDCNPDILLKYENKLIAANFNDSLMLNKNYCLGKLRNFRLPDNYQYEKTACQYCKSEFSTNGINWHEQLCDLNPFKAVPVSNCSHCGKSVMVRMIKRHERACSLNSNKIKIQHNKPKKVNCPHCDKLFSHGHLHSHLTSCVKNPNYISKYACKFCTKDMRRKAHLNRHESICRQRPGYAYQSYRRVRTQCPHCAASISLNRLHQHTDSCLMNPIRSLRNPCVYCNKEHRNGPRDKQRHELKCEMNPANQI